MICSDQKLSVDVIECRPDKAPGKILSMKNVFKGFKSYFDEDAWLPVQNLLKMKEDNANVSWVCKICDVVLLRKDRALGCDSCEEWFHFRCANVK